VASVPSTSPRASRGSPCPAGRRGSWCSAAARAARGRRRRTRWRARPGRFRRACADQQRRSDAGRSRRSRFVGATRPMPRKAGARRTEARMRTQPASLLSAALSAAWNVSWTITRWRSGSGSDWTCTTMNISSLRCIQWAAGSPAGVRATAGDGGHDCSVGAAVPPVERGRPTGHTVGRREGPRASPWPGRERPVSP